MIGKAAGNSRIINPEKMCPGGLGCFLIDTQAQPFFQKTGECGAFPSRFRFGPSR